MTRTLEFIRLICEAQLSIAYERCPREENGDVNASPQLPLKLEECEFRIDCERRCNARTEIFIPRVSDCLAKSTKLRSASITDVYQFENQKGSIGDNQ